MKDKNDIVYSLYIEDIQTVAVQEINRELTDDEIEYGPVNVKEERKNEKEKG